MLLLPAACTRDMSRDIRAAQYDTLPHLRSFYIVENRHGLSLHRRRTLAHVT